MLYRTNIVLKFRAAGMLPIHCNKFSDMSVFCPGFQKGRVPSEKGHFSAVNGPSKGHFSAVN